MIHGSSVLDVVTSSSLSSPMRLELTLVLQDKKSCMSFSSDEETELGRS